MNTELLEALTILEKEKNIRCHDGSNRKFSAQCL